MIASFSARGPREMQFQVSTGLPSFLGLMGFQAHSGVGRIAFLVAVGWRPPSMPMVSEGCSQLPVAASSSLATDQLRHSRSAGDSLALVGRATTSYNTA